MNNASPLATLRTGRTALLVIDMQRDFLDPGGYAAQAGLDVARLRSVIAPPPKRTCSNRRWPCCRWKAASLAR